MKIKILLGASILDLDTFERSTQSVPRTIRSAWRAESNTFRFNTGYDGRPPASGKRTVHHYEVSADDVEVLTPPNQRPIPDARVVEKKGKT